MRGFEALVEERIRVAIERGDLSGLPGEGRPLDLDDDRFVPEELRLAYRILKNAGFVPAEVEIRREIGRLECALADAGGAERVRAMKRLEVLSAQLGRDPLTDLARSTIDYSPAVVAKLARRPG